MNTFKLLVFLLLSFCAIANGFEVGIKLESVTSHPDKFTETRRSYVAYSNQELQTRFEFIAEKLTNTKTWRLFLKTNKIRSVAGGGSDINTDQILYLFLDRFISDVPNANVSVISIELMANKSIWGDYKIQAIRLFRKKPGVVKAKDHQLDSFTHEYLRTSTKVGDIAHRVCKKFNRKVKNINLASDGLAFEPDCYGKKWSDLIDKRNLGIEPSTLLMGIIFESKTLWRGHRANGGRSRGQLLTIDKA